MNNNVARHTAQAFRINFRDMITEANEDRLPEGLKSVLRKVRDFATEAGELDLNRPDSTTAFFQEDMAKVWFHAQNALRDTLIVGSKITKNGDYSFGAERDREHRTNIIWNMKWIEATLRSVTN